MDISKLPLLERDGRGMFPKMKCHICEKAMGNSLCLAKHQEELHDNNEKTISNARRAAEVPLLPTHRLNNNDAICGRATCLHCDTTGGDLEKLNLCICHYNLLPGIDQDSQDNNNTKKGPCVANANFGGIAQPDKEKHGKKVGHDVLHPSDDSRNQQNKSELDEWRKMFESKLQKHFEERNSNRSFLSEHEYQDIKSTLSNYDHFISTNKKRSSVVKCDLKLRKQIGGCEEESLALESEIIELGNRKAKMQRWFKKYELLPSGVLIFKRRGAVSLQESVTVSHAGRMFTDIYDCHTTCGSHLAMTKTFEGVKAKFGTSISRNIVQMFFGDCHKCMMTQTTKPAANSSKSFLRKNTNGSN